MIKEAETELKIVGKIEDNDKAEIIKGLKEYNLEKIEDKSVQDLGIYIEDKTGKKLGGLLGDTHGNWLTIHVLWVTKNMRGQGIGSSILKQAEKTAKERGCKYALLDTFDFQAPLFYKKHGYNQGFVLDEYPLTGKRYYFTKKL